MNPIVFKRSSWHYWLARHGDEFHLRDLTNICGYTRAVIAGFIWLIVKVVASIVVTYSFGETFAWIAAMVVNSTFFAPRLGTVPALGILLALGVGLLGYGFTVLLSGPDPNSGFIGPAYRSFKDKYCAKVEIK